ncbi:hypothetical protein C8R43DRAFT_1103554 [Mycena crocata]|nr:hypothetical protein C8R43DRAFT_1103554 [Mycena crocata]
MPAQPTVTQIRLQNIAACFAVTVDTLDAIARSFETPFLQPITNTAKSLLSAVETVRTNKENCAHLMEQTYKLVSAIISLHLQYESGPDFSPATLNHLGRFTDTLHKIHTFVEAQQDRGKINRFFRQGEMGALLKNCNAGLREALDAFKVHDAELLKDVAEMQKYAQERHQEVLDLIEASSEAVSSDRASSVNRVYFGSYNSSNSISMLPSEPKIFHGRESQLADILEHFATGAPRIAILGAGGMGKTSLARAILHHPQVTARYDHHRYFIACDTASSKLELVALIGAHLGLKAGTDLTKPVIKYFSNSLPSLLIIDNLETLWEPLETRLDIEEFLSLLADIQDLALIANFTTSWGIIIRGTTMMSQRLWLPFKLLWI